MSFMFFGGTQGTEYTPPPSVTHKASLASSKRRRVEESKDTTEAGSGALARAVSDWYLGGR